MKKKSRYVIEVLDTAFDVIEFLQRASGEPQGASAVAQALGINRNRAFRILKTLEHRDYVELDLRTRGYRLSSQFIDIAEDMHERINLQALAETVLDDLARKTGETANLISRFGNQAILIERRLGTHRLQVEEPVGSPYPLHIGAAPKIILAYLPDKERNRLIDEMELTPYTPNTIVERDELRRVVDRIREVGYVIDEEEYEIGACAIGAPVQDHRGRVVAAISASFPKARFSPERNQSIVEATVKASERLSALLGWQEGEGNILTD
jgi:DNA-binding IclR family transcriptional regulator